ncbi:alkyl hydroperoxide reductase subunit C [Enterobacter cloacae]|uniref:Alkyl hydroperoxide reductase C n=1 Tax=Enterobacter cloacae TaxID=550 RepID=A0A377M4U0_ENTCL|nr:alkyl hydroperoxide reductase subunit C [Enterobacter cloacae]
MFFFYPADFTFVCPTELGDVADHYDELQKLGVDVYSVSTDTHFTHKRGTAALKPSRKSNTR